MTGVNGNDGLNGMNGVHADEAPALWNSPAFVQSKKLFPGSFFDASLDPFADDDGFVVGRGRKRTKFTRHSGSWKLLDGTPSPEKETEPPDLEDVPDADKFFDEDYVRTVTTNYQSENASAVTIPTESHVSEIEAEAELSSEAIGTAEDPTAPSNLSDQASTEERADFQAQRTPFRGERAQALAHIDIVGSNNIRGAFPTPDAWTPRLQPLQSPGLPLISPLIRRQGVVTGYFPVPFDTRSELDASSDQIGDQEAPPETQAGVLPDRISSVSKESSEDPFTHDPFAPKALLTDEKEALSFLGPGSALAEPSGWAGRYVSPALVLDDLESGHSQQSTAIHRQSTVVEEVLEIESPVDGSFENERSDQTIQPEMKHSMGSAQGSKVEIRDGGEIESSDSPSDRRPDQLTLMERELQSSMVTPLVEGVLASANEELQQEISILHTGSITNLSPTFISTEILSDAQVAIPIDPNLFSGSEQAAFVTQTDGNQPRADVIQEEDSKKPRQRVDKIDLSAVECESDVVLSPPPFPFKQHWDRELRSRKARRASQPMSFDGTIEELEPSNQSSPASVAYGPGEISHDEELNDSLVQESGNNLDAPDHEPILVDLTSSPGDQVASFPKVFEAHGRPSDGVVGISEAAITEAKWESLPVATVIIATDLEKTAGSIDVEEPSPPTLQSQELVVEIEQIRPEDRAIDVEQDDSISMDVLGKLDDYDAARVLSYNSAHDQSPRSQEPPSAVIIDSPLDTVNLQIIATGQATEHLAGLELPDFDHVDEASDIPIDPILVTRLPRQLITPENTQVELVDFQHPGLGISEEQEYTMPPTPQNTQELSDLPQPSIETTGMETVENESLKVAAASEATIKDATSLQRRSPRLSRKVPPRESAVGTNPEFMPQPSNETQPIAQPGKPPHGLHEPVSVIGVEYQERPGQDRDQDDTISVQPEAAATNIASDSASIKVGLTTALSYYTPLSLLSDHFSRPVDVMVASTAVSTDAQKARTGPRDYHTTLHLADSSLVGSTTITMQAFRPLKTALPRVQRGDVILLRNVKVQSRKRKCLLLSTESSSWAVFSLHNDSGSEQGKIEAKVAGPPVEYGLEEVDYALWLKAWWNSEGADRHPQLQQNEGKDKQPESAKGKETATEEEDPLSTKSDTDMKADLDDAYHELRDGTLYSDEKPVTIPPPAQEDSGKHVVQTRSKTEETLYDSDNEEIGSDRENDYVSANEDQDNSDGEESVTDQAASSQLYHELRNGRRYADPVPPSKPKEGGKETRASMKTEESVVHELRDGKAWVDDGRPSSSRSERKAPRNSLVHELRDGVSWIDE